MRLVGVAALVVSAALWGLSAVTGLGGTGLGSAATLNALAAASAAVGLFLVAAEAGGLGGGDRGGR